MKLQRTYKQGTLIKFKWYDDYRDRWENPSNFRVIEGVVQYHDHLFFDNVTVHNSHDNVTYIIYCDDIIQNF